MPINPLLTRRQCLAVMAAGAAMPFAELQAAAENKMRGALMILSTPYTQSGEVDYEDLAREVAFCDRCGVQGLVWPQNSSEQRYLSKAERLRGFEVLAESNRGRNMALVLAVQAEDTAGMLEYARAAEALTPDGMIAIPPTSANSLAEIHAYYAALWTKAKGDLAVDLMHEYANRAEETGDEELKLHIAGSFSDYRQRLYWFSQPLKVLSGYVENIEARTPMWTSG